MVQPLLEAGATSHDALARRWTRLVAACAADPRVAAAPYDRLVQAYGDRNRRYHTLNHIARVFADLDAVPLWEPAVEWAVWYHDAIYRAGATDNEIRSAALARQTLVSLGLASGLGARVGQLIEATSRHQADVDDRSALLFLDADMAILGASPADYANYAAAIRYEYRHLPAARYRRGRAAFLREVLERPVLYLSAHFRRRHERQARINLGWELGEIALGVERKSGAAAQD